MKKLLIICFCGFTLLARATTTEPRVTYEEEAVAAVLMGEAWSDGTRGMTAVAEVIHQRSIEKHQAPMGVISVHHAFSCLNKTTVDRLIAKYSHEPAYQQALQLAELTCEDPQRLPNLVGPANHYTRASERPYWAQGHQPLAIVGGHAFYRLSKY